MTLANLCEIAHSVAAVALVSDTVQANAQAFFGNRLRAYVGGVDTFNADTPEERFPYIVVYPVSTDSTNGNRASVIRVELNVRADRLKDTTKPRLQLAEDSLLIVGVGLELSTLADSVEEAIRNGNIGAVVEGVRVELDLQNQYPVQSVTFEIELSDTMTF